MGKLVLHLPDGSTREVVLARERMTIGRRVDNDICLPLPTVSAEHAAVVTVLDDSFLEDMGSRNGTLVNGKPIRKHLLRDHDEIDIGKQRLVYFLDDDRVDVGAAPAATTPADEAPRAWTGATAAAPGTANVVQFGAHDDGRPARREDAASLALIDTAELFAPPAAAPEPAAPVAGAPVVEVLDGRRAGERALVDGEAFVLGRVGQQLAVLRRTGDGYRLEHLEGDVRPLLNGAPLPEEGALLARGDDIAVAGTRLRYGAVG
jgi:hypothetical protein